MPVWYQICETHKEEYHRTKEKKIEEDDIQIPLEAASCQHDSVVSLTLTQVV